MYNTKNNVMTKLLCHLFEPGGKGTAASVTLLGQRVILGCLFMSHGLQKMSDFSSLVTTFPNPLGMGAGLSLSLVIFSEVFCTMAFILGFMHRLVLIPMIFSMGIAFFCVHDGNVAEGEPAFIYFVMFLLLFISGPGRFSADNYIYSLLKRAR